MARIGFRNYPIALKLKYQCLHQLSTFIHQRQAYLIQDSFNSFFLTSYVARIKLRMNHMKLILKAMFYKMPFNGRRISPAFKFIHVSTFCNISMIFTIFFRCIRLSSLLSWLRCFVSRYWATLVRPPLSVCRSMVPGHMVPAQNSAPPYNITLNATTYQPGDTIEGI